MYILFFESNYFNYKTFKYIQFLFNNMQRKVNRVGASTLTVSLPSAWAKQHSITKGSTVELKLDNNQLIIYPTTYKSEKKTYTLDLRGIKKMQKNLIYYVLKKGFDEVTVLFDDPSFLAVLQKLLREEIIWYELVEQTRNSCLISLLLNESEQTFEKSIRKLFQVTLALAENIQEFAQKKDLEMLKSTLKLEKSSNRLSNLCQRCLVTNTTYPQEQQLALFTITYILEKIADEFKYLIQEILKTKKIDSKINQSMKAVLPFLKKIYKLFYDFDFKEASDLFGDTRDLTKRRYTLYHYLDMVPSYVNQILGLISFLELSNKHIEKKYFKKTISSKSHFLITP